MKKGSRPKSWCRQRQRGKRKGSTVEMFAECEAPVEMLSIQGDRSQELRQDTQARDQVTAVSNVSDPCFLKGLETT